MGVFRTVLVFIKTTAGPAGTAIADTRGAVTSGAMKRTVLRTVRCTLAAVNTFFIMIALQSHFTLMSKGSVKLNLLADSGFILADGLCDGSFRGTIRNTGENDTPFLQS